MEKHRRRSMIIDGHAHACGQFLTCEGLERYLMEHKIDRVVLCGGEAESTKNYHYPMLSNVFWGQGLAYAMNRVIQRMSKKSDMVSHMKEENMMVYAMARKLPDRISNAYWINPEDPEAIRAMEDFYNHYGFCMVKLHQCWSTFMVDSAVCNEIYKWAAARKLPVFIHLLNKGQVKRFVEVANQNRKTTFIVAHMIGAKYMRGKLKYNNVYFDLSAPQLYSKRTMRSALRYYGASRLVLGSDTPYGRDNVDRVRKRLKKMKLSKAKTGQILGDNMKWLLKLK